MAKIVTRVIKVKRAATGRRPTKAEKVMASQEQEARRLSEWRKREAMRERAQKAVTYRSDGVMRCSKCPPTTCCPDCARINNARVNAGLIRPRDDPRPHANNIVNCMPQSQGYMGSRPYGSLNAPGKIVSMDVTHLGGGWWLGAATLGLETIYERKFRSEREARRYAVNSMADIRAGLEYERTHA